MIHLCADGRKRRRVCGISVDVAGIRDGVEGDAKMGVADLQGGSSFHVAGRHVVQHDDVSGTFLAAERYFRGGRPFDQPQARLDVPIRLTRSDTTARWASFRSWGASSTAAAAALCMDALLTFLLGVRCYLCVRPWSRTNTGAFWFGMDLDTVIEVCVTFHYAWAMEHD